jgi:uncharacterized repeat protein (TIGR01451 family)
MRRTHHEAPQSSVLSGRSLRALLAFFVLGSTLFVGVVTTPAPALAASVDCSRGVNLSWESPVLDRSWRGFPQADVAGWSSSSGVIEIWQSGFLGAVAPDGAQLSELQANDNSPSWQDIASLPGDRIDWSFLHRGRENTDTVVVRIGSTTSQSAQGTFSTGTASFVRYSGTYVVPDGQTTTRFMLDPEDTGSVGNLVDAVALTLECDVSVSSSVGSTADVDGSGDISVGDEVVFTYDVANDGTASLVVAVTESLGDAVSCPASMLAPDGTMTCSSTHVVTQADVDAGAVSSQAHVTGTDAAGVTVSSSNGVAVDIEQRPSVSLIKSGSVDATVVAPDSRPDVGDVITYAFDVANTGNVTLESIAVADALAPVTCPQGSLAPGTDMTCSAAYSINQTDIDTGGVDNSATATALSSVGDEVASEDSIWTDLDQQPSVSVAKNADVSTFTTPGDELEYSIVVTNTGNVSLADVHVTDDTADAGSLGCDGILPAVLLPGEGVNCTAARTVTQSDIDDGNVSNTATASGQDPDGRLVVAQDTVTVDADQSPSIVIEKVAAIDNTIILPLDRTDAGDHIGYTITVTNIGNVTLSDLVVTDHAIEDLVCDTSGAAPGESVVCKGIDTIEQSGIDAGEVPNTAGATAVAPLGDIVEAEVTISTAIDQEADVAVAKTAVATSNGDGSFNFAYTIEVSNPGNATLTDVQIEDDLEAAFGDLEFSVTSLSSESLTVNPAYNGTTDIDLLAGADRLSPGATARVELVVLAFTRGAAGPFTNEASVVAGESTLAVADTNSVQTHVDVSFDLSMDVISPMSAGQGEQITWTLAVANNGPSVAPGPITVTNVLGDGLSFVSAAGPGWVCAYDGTAVTCVHAGDFVAGSSAAITLVTVATADQGATISNAASVSVADSTNESTFANNTDSASVQVEALPVTGLDVAALGRMAAVLILAGLILVAAAGRRRPDESA